MLPYRRSHLKGRMNYEESQRHCKRLDKKLHFGQLKLLISEVLFLTRTSKGGETVIYAGAASGYHIYMLAEMFPKLKFELWDSRPYEIEEHPNIQKNNGLFTNELAEKYAQRGKGGEEFLFMSDIRTLEFGNVQKIKDHRQKEKEDLRIITDDMRMQMEWCQIINPNWAYLKFRLPYADGQTEYLTGKIYLQPYSPISTETRLLTNNYHTTTLYDNEENDELMAYFNCNVRFKPLDDHRWDNIMDNYGVKKNWDNYISFYVMAYYLEKKNGDIPSDKEVVELFNEAIKYHRKIFGNKYDYLYED
jgi:Poly A polymerase regulatory subunit